MDWQLLLELDVYVACVLVLLLFSGLSVYRSLCARARSRKILQKIAKKYAESAVKDPLPSPCSHRAESQTSPRPSASQRGHDEDAVPRLLDPPLASGGSFRQRSSSSCKASDSCNTPRPSGGHSGLPSPCKSPQPGGRKREQWPAGGPSIVSLAAPGLPQTPNTSSPTGYLPSPRPSHHQQHHQESTNSTHRSHRESSSSGSQRQSVCGSTGLAEAGASIQPSPRTPQPSYPSPPSPSICLAKDSVSSMTPAKGRELQSSSKSSSMCFSSFNSAYSAPITQQSTQQDLDGIRSLSNPTLTGPDYTDGSGPFSSSQGIDDEEQRPFIKLESKRKRRKDNKVAPYPPGHELACSTAPTFTSSTSQCSAGLASSSSLSVVGPARALCANAANAVKSAARQVTALVSTEAHHQQLSGAAGTKEPRSTLPTTSKSQEKKPQTKPSSSERKPSIFRPNNKIVPSPVPHPEPEPAALNRPALSVAVTSADQQGLSGGGEPDLADEQPTPTFQSTVSASPGQKRRSKAANLAPLSLDVALIDLGHIEPVSSSTAEPLQSRVQQLIDCLPVSLLDDPAPASDIRAPPSTPATMLFQQRSNRPGRTAISSIPEHCSMEDASPSPPRSRVNVDTASGHCDTPHPSFLPGSSSIFSSMQVKPYQLLASLDLDIDGTNCAAASVETDTAYLGVSLGGWAPASAATSSSATCIAVLEEDSPDDSSTNLVQVAAAAMASELLGEDTVSVEALLGKTSTNTGSKLSTRAATGGVTAASTPGASLLATDSAWDTSDVELQTLDAISKVNWSVAATPTSSGPPRPLSSFLLPGDSDLGLSSPVTTAAAGSSLQPSPVPFARMLPKPPTPGCPLPASTRGPPPGFGTMTHHQMQQVGPLLMAPPSTPTAPMPDKVFPFARSHAVAVPGSVQYSVGMAACIAQQQQMRPVVLIPGMPLGSPSGASSLLAFAENAPGVAAFVPSNMCHVIASSPGPLSGSPGQPKIDELRRLLSALKSGNAGTPTA